MRFLLLTVFLISLFSPRALAVDQGDIDALKQKIDEYSEKVSELQNAKNTLSAQIAYMNSQIELTVLKISQTEQKIVLLESQIGELSEKISDLDVSLNKLSAVFLTRVSATYKTGKTDPLIILMFSPNINNFFLRYKYLKALQLNDRKVLLAMEEARYSYDLQKQEKEEKQKELEGLKATLAKQKLGLDQQKKDKEHLLAVTKSDEKKYQEMLASAMAEFRAIQAIVAGQGDEKQIGSVSEGERIASVILGSSPCSTGTHLHFEVHDGDTVVNPFSFLGGTTLDNRSGDAYYFGGNWIWPLNAPIELTQGFGGDTWWIRTGGAPYKFHSGIDIVADDSSVKSVKPGTLYNGSIRCGSGYLRYVKVKHQDTNFSTYYLHINYEKV